MAVLVASGPALAQSQRTAVGRFLTSVFDDNRPYVPTSLDVGEDGHIVIAATVSGGPYTVSAALVARFDGTGKKLWERSPAARADLVSTMIARTAPHGDTMVLFDDSPTEQPQLVLLRLAVTGKELWRRQLGPGAPSDLLVEPDGAAIVSGSARRDKGSAFDALVLRVAPDGKVAWRRQVPGEKADSGNTADLVRGAGGGQYIAGGLTDIAYADNSTVNASRGLLVKLGSDGQIAWRRSFGSGNTLTMVSGLAASGADMFVVTLTESSGGGQFFELSRVAANGTVAWTRPLAGPPDQEINDIAPAPNGGLVLAGSEPNGDSRAAVLILLDRDGIERQRVNYRGYKMRRALMARPYPTAGFAVLFEGAGSSSDATLYLARVDASGRF
ncbi:MAG: PQQ-binding-like beta-propeller repeat protein [Rhodospirillales bacterium]